MLQYSPMNTVSLVRDALAAPSYAEFSGTLQAAGFSFTIRGSEPALVPEGSRHIRLSRLGLSREFWLAFAKWDDGFAVCLQEQGPKALASLWQGLTGVSLSSPSRRRAKSLAWQRGAKAVAQAMLSAVQENTGVSVDRQFARAVDLCVGAPREAGHATQPPAPSTPATESPATSATGEALLPRQCKGMLVSPLLSRPPLVQHDLPRHVVSTFADRRQFLNVILCHNLQRPLRSCFEGAMLAEGYALTLSGGEHFLHPVGGGTLIPLTALGLNEELWMRHCEWPDGLALERWEKPVQILAFLWQGLFGSPPCNDDLEALRQALKALPPLAVAFSLYATRWRQPQADPDYRRRYFCKVWRSEAGKKPSVNGRPVSRYPVPSDSRPEYRRQSMLLQSRPQAAYTN